MSLEVVHLQTPTPASPECQSQAPQSSTIVPSAMIIDRNSGGIDALLSLASAAAMCSAKPKYSVSDNRSTQRATPTISPTLNWAWGRIDHSASYAGAPAARVLDTDLATIDAVATIRRDRGDTTSPPLTGSRSPEATSSSLA